MFKHGSAVGLCLALLAATAAPAASVVTYHNSNTRHGLYLVPGLTAANAGTLQLNAAFNATISGNVYAQPLYWRAPHSAFGVVIVATQNNIVYALNGNTGAVVWQRQLPAPITSGLPCGDINPEGITGTPVIDPATATLYLNLQTTIDGSPEHFIYALSLQTGAVQTGWPISMRVELARAGVTFTPATQGARSALLLFGTGLYATYGGRAGDCGAYHGVIAHIDTVTRRLEGNWETRANGGGIWSQGGISSDGKYLYTTTGNTFGANNVWGDGEAIIRLQPGLAHATTNADYYAPANWQSLDNGDADLGGTEALPLNVATAGGGTTQSMAALGKDGNAYLVPRQNLGGIGGPATITQVSNSAIITGPAVYNTPTATLLAFTSTNGSQCSGANLQMLDLQVASGNPIGMKWCAPLSGRGSPIFTTSGNSADPLVWVLGAEGDNKLHGYDAINGTAVYTAPTALTGLRRFQTLIVADNHFYIAADNKVYAYTFTP